MSTFICHKSPVLHSFILSTSPLRKRPRLYNHINTTRCVSFSVRLIIFMGFWNCPWWYFFWDSLIYFKYDSFLPLLFLVVTKPLISCGLGWGVKSFSSFRLQRSCPYVLFNGWITTLGLETKTKVGLREVGTTEKTPSHLLEILHVFRKHVSFIGPLPESGCHRTRVECPSCTHFLWYVLRITGGLRSGRTRETRRQVTSRTGPGVGVRRRPSCLVSPDP